MASWDAGAHVCVGGSRLVVPTILQPAVDIIRVWCFAALSLSQRGCPCIALPGACSPTDAVDVPECLGGCFALFFGGLYAEINARACTVKMTPTGGLVLRFVILASRA